MPLTYPDPIPALKQQLAAAVLQALDGWRQLEGGAMIGIDQPRMSNLRRGRLERFSLEKLARLVSRAGGDLQLTVVWTPRNRIARIGTPTYVPDPEVARARAEMLRERWSTKRPRRK